MSTGVTRSQAGVLWGVCVPRRTREGSAWSRHIWEMDILPLGCEGFQGPWSLASLEASGDHGIWLVCCREPPSLLSWKGSQLGGHQHFNYSSQFSMVCSPTMKQALGNMWHLGDLLPHRSIFSAPGCCWPRFQRERETECEEGRVKSGILSASIRFSVIL